ncbi:MULTISPECIES: alkaline phosphatase family protein [unclassified Pseudomonas]|uniref:alkaline phosphatase family protein n=1 Tax=unclassified Pseudomonas TaxID=196821 RepID=UPI00131D7A3A|nr:MULTISPECIES: alkaline phosphatase family protein [unclassified Pseudomonas]
MSATPTLPPVLAGPLLRRTEASRLLLWLVTTTAEAPVPRLWQGEVELGAQAEVRCLRLGEHAYLQLIDVRPDAALPVDAFIHYDVRLAAGGIADWAPHLLSMEGELPRFVLRARFDHLLHGSCRKPHHASADGLIAVDHLLQACTAPEERPAALLLTGDQVYADDVAGPMLLAVQALIRRLGLYGEDLEGAVVADSEALMAHAANLYHREDLLPAFKSNRALREKFFGGVEKPIFTSTNAHNHLVTLSEVLALYLLCWSPTPWTLIEVVPPALDAKDSERYAAESRCIDGFVATLPQAARSLAWVPTLMIFDDHDVTDDWNLSARWEETAYGHPFSRRILGNALLAYLLCQAWGNAPEAVAEPLAVTARLLDTAGGDGTLDCPVQNSCIDDLLRFQGWHYVLKTDPPLIVLDTRTRRWRSERRLEHPSGLMDWEALCELQQDLLDHPSAVIVSAAPMFGVKLIEAVQRIFTWFGQPLMVDAENWMAHPGAAKTMLNIFRHRRTPGNYVVLSGDVHYSFVYDIRIRDRRGEPRLWQITSSGIKNEFPPRLLATLDRLNRWLYAPWSPLNGFTKRRRWELQPRLPDRREAGERLWNGAGIGQVLLDEEGRPAVIRQHNADGSPATAFVERPA